MVGWLVDWLMVVWLVGWLIDWLVDLQNSKSETNPKIIIWRNLCMSNDYFQWSSQTDCSFLLLSEHLHFLSLLMRINSNQSIGIAGGFSLFTSTGLRWQLLLLQVVEKMMMMMMTIMMVMMTTTMMMMTKQQWRWWYDNHVDNDNDEKDQGWP